MIALDVAYGELDYRLREDDRVTVIERANARALAADDLPYRPDLIVIDVSFISLSKVLPAVLAGRRRALRLPGDGQAAVRGRPRPDRQGRRGPRPGAAARGRQRRRRRRARELGAAVMGSAPSALAGPSGNRETFLWLAEGSRAGAVDEVEAW